jgi:hypothetical protein
MHHSEKLRVVTATKKFSHRYEGIVIVLSVLGLIFMTGIYLLFI